MYNKSFMKHSIIKAILALVLLMPTALFAQNNGTTTITLPPQASRSAVENIAAIEILTPNGNPTFIGIMPSASANMRNNITVSEGLQNWLQTYVNHQFSPNYSKLGKKVQWIINRFSVGIDSSADGLVSFVNLSADIVKLENSQMKPVELSVFDTLIVSNHKTADGLGQHIAVAISSLYQKTISPVAAKKSTELEAYLQQQKELASANLRSSQILKDSVYPTGIYTSFLGFKNNAPSVSHFLTMVDSVTKQVSFYKMAADSSLQPIKNAWGMAINNELYKFENGQLYAIEKNAAKDGFSLSKYIDYRRRKNQALFWRKNIGSRQGDDNPYNDAHIYRTQAGMLKIETTQLDIATGELTY